MPDKKKISLYSIDEDFLKIEYMLIESGGEITPEIEAALLKNETDLFDKAEAYFYWLKSVQLTIDNIDVEVKRLQQKKKVAKNLLESRLTMVKASMEHRKIKELSAGVNSFEIVGVGGVLTFAECDVELLPKKYVTRIEIEQVTIDQDTLRKDCMAADEKIAALKVSEDEITDEVLEKIGKLEIPGAKLNPRGTRLAMK